MKYFGAIQMPSTMTIPALIFCDQTDHADAWLAAAGFDWDEGGSGESGIEVWFELTDPYMNR